MRELVLLTLVGCATAPPAAPSQPRIDTLIPARALRGQAAPRASLEQARVALGSPAIVAAAWTPAGIVFADAWGAPRDAAFQSASISKTVSCLVAYRLVDRGVLALDTDVNDKLVRWKVPATPGRPLTLRELCDQTSGLAQVTPDLSGGYERGAPLPSIVQMLEGVPPSHLEPLRFEVAPGTRTQWSGENWLVLQLLVEDATHRPFADVANELVLAPLAMHSASFEQPRQALMPGHEPDGTPVPGGSHVHPELAAVGLTLSASDAARFMIEIERIVKGRSRLLSAALQLTFATAVRERRLGLSPDPPAEILSTGTHAYGYLGPLIGELDAERGVVVIVGCHERQRGCGELGFAVARTIVQDVGIHWTWPPLATRVLDVVPTDLAALAGTWRFPANDAMPETTCEVAPDGNALRWSCTGLPPRVVYPIGRGRFAGLVESPDLVFEGDAVRVVYDGEVLRAGARVR